MKITIESTDRIITLVADSGSVPARLWEGTTDSGIKVQVAVTRIAAESGENLEQFEKELLEQRAPTSDSMAFPLRMIL